MCGCVCLSGVLCLNGPIVSKHRLFVFDRQLLPLLSFSSSCVYYCDIKEASNLIFEEVYCETGMSLFVTNRMNLNQIYVTIFIVVQIICE